MYGALTARLQCRSGGGGEVGAGVEVCGGGGVEVSDDMVGRS
jgi:hypothetical protein